MLNYLKDSRSFMDIFKWLRTEFKLTETTSEKFIYDDLESQSFECLPIIYKTFDIKNKEHWADRGALYDFLFSINGEGKKILDFGPGDGWPSLIIAPFVKSVIGVDSSFKRVEVCRKNAERLGISNVKFIEIPVSGKLPFDDNTFDGITAASSVEQAPNPRTVLKELFRVLKPGGRFRISYEGLNRYRNGQEADLWLGRVDEQNCFLILYDRYIDDEFVEQYNLKFSISESQLKSSFGVQDRNLKFGDLNLEGLNKVKDQIKEVKFCKTTHPSGKTFIKWMKEIGFSSVSPTHKGNLFVYNLFDNVPEDERPRNLEELDRLLKPLIKVVINLPAPIELDPMLNGIKF